MNVIIGFKITPPCEANVNVTLYISIGVIYIQLVSSLSER